MTTQGSIDPVTFTVVSNKLWAINTEGAIALRRISGSPVATEANDMNTSLMTPKGETLLAGSYILSGAVGQGLILQEILRRYQDNPGIAPDDMFLCNDPYSGALHQTCVTLLGPIHWQGEPVLWAGATIHLADVGGATPGQISLGAKSIYEEAPLIPPIKIVEGGRVRRDLEEEYLIRSRTRDLNALDLRAKIAAINVAKRRVRELIEGYSIEVVRGVAEAIIDHTETRLRARLAELPDGVWRHVSYVDYNDGEQISIYPIRLTLTKQGSDLIFDFTGSAAQAPAVVNCTYAGVLSGVVIATLAYLCFDIPWSPAGVIRVIRVVAEPGTVVNASWPAGVCKATTAAGFEVTTVASACLAKLLTASDRYRDKLMAPWNAGSTIFDIFGTDQRGAPFGTVILDSMAGGSGAGCERDGIDTGGFIRSLSCAVANIETMEFRYPLLYLSRRQQPDSGGAGRFRGGVAICSLVTPHDVEEIAHCTIHISCCAQPGATGIYGGYPGSSNHAVIKRRSNVEALLEGGKLPTELEEIEGKLEVIPGLAVTTLKRGDVYRVTMSGGGGYGDPLDRDPMLVARDVESGLVSPEWAARLYGVAVNPDNALPDVRESERLRQALRAKRGKAQGKRDHWPTEGKQVVRLTEALSLVEGDEGWVTRCRCGRVLCKAGEPYKAWVLQNDLPLQHGGPMVNPFGIGGDRFVLRQFCCPSCLTLLDVEVQLRDDPPLQEVKLVFG